MKICITAQENKIDSLIDPRFGRCQYFVIVDTDTGETEILENPNKDGMGGVGIQSGQMMAENKVKAVLTGNVGPNAFKTLQASNIEVITGLAGKVEEAVEKYKNGELSAAENPSVDPHFGTNGRNN